MITFSSKPHRTIFVALVLGSLLGLSVESSFSQTVLTQQQAGNVLAIEKVAAQADGTVTRSSQ